MYPIAWAIVEGENNRSWCWFMTHLQKCLDLGDGTDVAIVSDEYQFDFKLYCLQLPLFFLWLNIGIVQGTFMPYAIKPLKGDEMKLLFWKIAKEYNLADYNDALDELATVNEDAATAFKSYNPKCFCRAFMSTSMKVDVITNNLAETFNDYIVNARTKHLIYMIEDIRASLMQRLVVMRQEMERISTTTICPRIQARLEKEKTKAAHCNVLPSRDNLFEVNFFLDKLIIDLDAKTCTCRKWDLTGIPCCHAISAIFFLHKKAEDFVDSCYTKEVYLNAYAGSIPPCEGERHWPRVEVHIDPPPIKVGPGRPRKKRRKDPHESPKKPGKLTKHSIEMTCSTCQSKGHNKRKCPNKDTTPAQDNPPKRPKGRPRKYGQLPQPIPSQTAMQDAHLNTTAELVD